MGRWVGMLTLLGAVWACDDGGSTAPDDGPVSPDAGPADVGAAPDRAPPEPAAGADGEVCSVPADCQGTCYVLPMFGGTCGACAGDADCDGGGCNRPSLRMPVTPSSCHGGELGGACETDAACGDGLRCVGVIANALLTVAGCSDCETASDCGNGQLCTPAIDLGGLSGHRRCTEPGVLAIGETCDPDAPDAVACASGICAAVDVQGARVGVCSACRADADCAGAGGCVTAALDLATFSVTPGRCRE